MPLGSIAAAITFVIAFVMRIPQAASALAGILVFSGFLFRSFGKDKNRYRKSKSWKQ
jgi:hypothetical protein